MNSNSNFVAPLQAIELYALHGFTGNGADFDLIRTQLADRQSANTLPPINWTCPSLLGHRSICDLDCSAQAQLNHFTEQLKPKDESSTRVLLAYSMGARIALLHATQAPNDWDALILISCQPGIEKKSERIKRQKSDETLADALANNGLAWFLSHWQSLPVIRSQARAPESFQQKMALRKKHLSVQGLVQCLYQFGQGVCPNLWSAAKAISCPILCIHGAEDAKYSEIHQSFSQSLEKTNPFVSAQSIPRSGHAPHIENPIATASVIEKFLKKTIVQNTQLD